MVFAGANSGGQLMLTTDVENYPGFPEGIMGPELMENFRKQAERFGAEVHYENVVEVDFSSRPYKIKSATQEVEAKTVIISTGASAKMLGLESESRPITLRGLIGAPLGPDAQNPTYQEVGFPHSPHFCLITWGRGVRPELVDSDPK